MKTVAVWRFTTWSSVCQVLVPPDLQSADLLQLVQGPPWPEPLEVRKFKSGCHSIFTPMLYSSAFRKHISEPKHWSTCHDSCSTSRGETSRCSWCQTEGRRSCKASSRWAQRERVFMELGWRQISLIFSNSAKVRPEIQAKKLEAELSELREEHERLQPMVQDLQVSEGLGKEDGLHRTTWNCSGVSRMCVLVVYFATKFPGSEFSMWGWTFQFNFIIPHFVFNSLAVMADSRNMLLNFQTVCSLSFHLLSISIFCGCCLVSGGQRAIGMDVGADKTDTTWNRGRLRASTEEGTNEPRRTGRQWAANEGEAHCSEPITAKSSLIMNA